MTASEKKLEHAMKFLEGKLPFRPKLAIVLGSGLGAFADRLEITSHIPYEEIPDFPVSTVAGHSGRFIFGYAFGTPVVLMQGRVHYYEGYSSEEVVLPIRLMRRMGAEDLILTNAAGALHSDWNSGELMLIRDQIACFVPSPLIGQNPATLGVRFPDMSHIYDEVLGKELRDAAKNEGIPLREGVYIQTTGPQYESFAEVKMCMALGADAVGMSTAIEAIAARHCGFRICGISCITNPAGGLCKEPLSHEEVTKAADQASERFAALLLAFLKRYGQMGENPPIQTS